jgi:hypothetical protein
MIFLRLIWNLMFGQKLIKKEKYRFLVINFAEWYSTTRYIALVVLDRLHPRWKWMRFGENSLPRKNLRINQDEEEDGEDGNEEGEEVKPNGPAVKFTWFSEFYVFDTGETKQENIKLSNFDLFQKRLLGLCFIRELLSKEKIHWDHLLELLMD